MIRKFFISILLLIYLTGVFNQLLPLLTYSINFEYIIKELCVQKDFKENTCQGKCHLKKAIFNGYNPESEQQPNVITSIREMNHHFPIADNYCFNKDVFKIDYFIFCENLFSITYEVITPPPENFII